MCSEKWREKGWVTSRGGKPGQNPALGGGQVHFVEQETAPATKSMQASDFPSAGPSPFFLFINFFMLQQKCPLPLRAAQSLLHMQ